jgi:hypothetical protein
MLSLRRAQELERQALATGQPTPRAAAEVLIAADAAELRAMDARREQLWERLARRMVRSNYEDDGQGRGLARNHPDRISQDQMAKLIARDNRTGHLDPMQVNRWVQRWLNRYGQPPVYKPADTDAPSTAAGP